MLFPHPKLHIQIYIFHPLNCSFYWNWYSKNFAKNSLKSITRLSIGGKIKLLINALATHFLAAASSEQLDRFIKFFDEIGPVYCEKVFSLYITLEEVDYLRKEFFRRYSFREFIKLLRWDEYVLAFKVAHWIIIYKTLKFFGKKFDENFDFKFQPKL